MPNLRQSSWTFFLVLAIFVSATLGMTAYTLWLLRTDAIKSGLEISSLLARSFEDHLTQSLHAAELAGVNAASSEDAQPNLRQMEKDFVFMLRSSPFLRSMSLLDENDRIIVSSNPANLGLVVAARDYVPVVSGVQPLLRIGTPWAGRDFNDGHPLSDQKTANTTATFVPVIHGIVAGRRNMTLLIALNTDYFLHHMSRQFDAKTGSVEVLRIDGMPLFATDPEQVVGASNNESASRLSFNDVEFGEFEQVLTHNRPVLTAFRVSSLYPLAIVTHIEREYALRQWLTETKTIIGIVVPTLLCVCLLVIALNRRQLLLMSKTAEANRLQQINAARVFSNSHEAIMITTADGCIVDVNDAFTRITGYVREEVLGQSTRILKSGRQTGEFYADLWKSLKRHGYWSGEIWNRHKSGDIFAEMLTISAVQDSQGIVQQFVAQFSDITKRKMVDEQVRLLAFYDPLTALPNRRMFNDRLSQAMAASKRSGLCAALMFLDLDNFKPLNDTHGHEVGDLLLVEVARRLKNCLREVDTVARFGGDEFVVMLNELNAEKSQSKEQARGVAEKIRNSLAAPYRLIQEQPGKGDRMVEHQCSTSIGVVVFANHDISEADLLKCADAAMYQAKADGRNAIRFHDPHATQAAQT